MSPCTSDSDIRRFAAALRGQSLDEYAAQDEHTRHTAEIQVETALQVTGFVMGTPLTQNEHQQDVKGPWPALSTVHPSVEVVIDCEGDWWRRTGKAWEFSDSWELFDRKTNVWRAFEISLRGTSCFAPFSTIEANMRRLVEQSSLGTESTRAAMESVSREHARRIAEEAARRAVCDAPSVIEGEKKADPFKALHNVITFSSRDFALDRTDAWIYGIVVGWDNEDPDPDPDPEELGAMDELAERYGWDAQTVAWLRALRSQWIRHTALPLIPARTDTGPWQTWNAVPDAVKYRELGDRDSTGLVWINAGGLRFTQRASGDFELSLVSDAEANELAPFVAAEAGQ